jgi:sec-independent protein translocase protein TatA
MFGLGAQELIIIFVIVLVLFGGKKIPELLRGVGRGVGELHKGLDEGKRQFQQSLQEDEDKPKPPENTQPAIPRSAA